MSDYIVNVSSVKLPTGQKYVRLSAQVEEGDLLTAMLWTPEMARKVAAEIIRAATAAERMIEIPSETFAGVRISDLKKGKN